MTTRTTWYVEYGTGNDHSTLEGKTSFTRESSFHEHFINVKNAFDKAGTDITWYKAHYVTYEIGAASVFVEIANVAKVMKPIRELNHALKK